MTDKPESETTAGLSVVPELPVVAWRRRYLKPTGLWNYASAIGSTESLLNRELGPQETEALTPHAPAQSTIAAQAAEIERLKREFAAALYSGKLKP